MNSIVACCHSVTLRAYAARDFRSQHSVPWKKKFGTAGLDLCLAVFFNQTLGINGGSRWAVWGNCSPNICGAPLWCPWKLKQIKKLSEPNNAVCLVKRQDLCAGLCPIFYRIVSTMPLFCNSATVSIFLCHVSTAPPYTRAIFMT